MKNIQIITRQFCLITGVAVAGAIVNAKIAWGLTISLDNNAPTNGIYSYSLTLDAGESINLGDPLVFRNLAGVTNATASNPYELGIGFEADTADFSGSELTTANSGSLVLNSVVQITSDAGVGNVNYEIFYSDTNGNPSFISDIILGPATTNSTPVPFEFAPGLGLICVAGWLTASKISQNM
ncbi:MAG: hypothetical protein QNJ41_16845 [Xenococcaceae cyanobacterium MO_188.B32]|nr:hypothetical protein [Xenococcaceae cyanobacterium MO_188.B32]